jgi:predicted Rossmann fold nucleotide-binding protein DprA/Smf involved in DNA uptake
MADLNQVFAIKSILVNPQILSVMPETFRPEYLDLIGNGDLLESPKIGLVCSIKCPGNVILKTMNLMQSLKDAGLCFISGFHSPLEQECLSLLMRSKNRLIICPARSIQKMRLPLEYREAMMANRLAIISPFGGKYQRASEENAEIRNRFVAALADRVLVLHAAPGGKIEKLVKEISGWGKPVYTINMFPCEVNNEQFHHKD